MKIFMILSLIPFMVLLSATKSVYGQCHGGSINDRNGNSNQSKKNTQDATISTEIIYYACTVHPEVRRLKPGICSKCNMSFEQKTVNLYKSKDSVYYSCSMHPELNENLSGNCPKCGMELIRGFKSID